MHGFEHVKGYVGSYAGKHGVSSNVTRFQATPNTLLHVVRHKNESVMFDLKAFRAKSSQEEKDQQATICLGLHQNAEILNSKSQ